MYFYFIIIKNIEEAVQSITFQ